MQVNWFRVVEWLSAVSVLLEKFEVSAVWVEVSSSTREEQRGERFWKVTLRLIVKEQVATHSVLSGEGGNWAVTGHSAISLAD